MKIVSIAPGTVNCGYAVWEDGKFTSFGSYNLLEMVHKKKKTDYPFIVKEFIRQTQLFDKVDVVLIENQMQARMKMIACSLRCFFWGKSVMIAPQSVRRYFKISNSNYKQNKKDSKLFVHTLLPKDQSNKLLKMKKADDVADAIIQLKFYLNKL